MVKFLQITHQYETTAIRRVIRIHLPAKDVNVFAAWLASFYAHPGVEISIDVLDAHPNASLRAAQRISGADASEHERIEVSLEEAIVAELTRRD